MATYEVSTWAELVAKLSATTLETRTIKLTADIDCNDAIPTGVGSTIPIYNSGDYPVVIDGSYTENDVVKNHVIRNLRTNVTSPVGIFNLNQYPSQQSSNRNTKVAFKNIDFINLILAGAPFINAANSGVIYNNTLTFNKCRFVGRRDRFLINYDGSGYSSGGNALTFTSCFFNIPYEPAGTDNTYVPLNRVITNASMIANYCRFKEEYNGWSLTMSGISNGSMTSAYNLDLNGCYMYGDIVGKSAIAIRSNGTQYNSALQNVIDADLWVTEGGASGTAIDVYSSKGIYKNRIRKWGDTTVVYTDTKKNSYSISVPPDKMTDAAWLYSQGFDIVVPE